MIFSRSNVFAYAAAVFYLLFTATVFANSIDSIRVWPSPHDTRVVMDLQSEAKYTYFTLTSPDRLVVDVQNTTMKAKLPVQVADSPVLKKVRSSSPAEKSSYRLVFELKSKVESKIFTLAPTGNGQYGHRLVVDFPHDDGPQSAATTTQSKPEPQTAKPSTKPANKPSFTSYQQPIVVAIDAGHGGEDPGSIGPTRKYEKHVTLAVAKKAAAKINAMPGMKAVLTRTGDYYVSLNKRSQIARQNKALLLISIHADSFTGPGPRGGSVFVLSTRRANTEIGRWVVKHEEQSQLLGGGGELLSNSNDKNVSQTVLDLQFSHSQTEGNKLALHVLEEMKKVTRLHTSKPVYASLAVLKSPDIPSILVETGFISNPTEEKLLINANHQDKLARSIANAVRLYFKENPPEGMMVANRSAPGVHKVKSGESLSLIAQKYGTTTAKLMSLNKLKSTRLNVGQELKISAQSSADQSAPASVSYSTRVITHTVKSGEFLGKIANKYNVSVNSIKIQNHLRSNTVRVGQKLKITVTDKQAAQNQFVIHRVKNGEFLSKIASRYGVTVTSIRQANQLRSDTLAVGQQLKIPQS